MNYNKIIIFVLILVILTVSISSISASDDLNNNTLSVTDNNEILSDSSKTVVVPFDPYNPNDVLLPKIQPAIDSANSGDTIIIKGSPVHVHATINKTLTVLSDGGTIDPCPHHTHEGLTQHGVFYITSKGNGSSIQGFTFINKDKAETPFSILIDGASNISIKDCTMNYLDSSADKFDGIIIKNSNNVILSNLFINNTLNGITIINSTNIYINDCIISYNENQAISIMGSSKNINICNNSILNNGKYGINLSSVNYVNILNNFIENNGISNTDSGSGIYVNTNITKLVVKGNIFLSNGLHAIMYDYRTRNLNNEDGANQLTIIDDNYFSAHTSMIIHHRIYIQNALGNIHYDAENDVYGETGTGNYYEGKSYVYMQHALIYDDIPCGFTYYTTSIPWSLEAPANNGKYDLNLKLSIKQDKKGVYSVLIVDASGAVASDFNAGYFTFYLNNCSSVTPQSGDIFRKILIKNGVATADFRSEYNSYKISGNVITAVFNGISDKIDSNLNIKFNVKDTDLPIYLATQLIASKLTTYPLSDSYFTAKLIDSNKNPISSQMVTFKVNGKTYKVKTDSRGIAKFKVSFTTKKTYSVAISYGGSDDYKSSKLTGYILVKTGSAKSKIQSSNIKIKKNKKKTFSLKLTSSSGKALKNQKITVKVNSKTYSIKTNSKGIAKLSLKFNKVKKYKISMKFLGNANYKAVSKTNTISVVK